MTTVTFHPIYFSTFPTLDICLYVEKYWIRNRLEDLKRIEFHNACFFCETRHNMHTKMSTLHCFNHGHFMLWKYAIRVAQRKRGGPITHRSQDRNLALIRSGFRLLFYFFSNDVVICLIFKIDEK